MSQKRAKQIRRKARQARQAIIDDYLDAIWDMSWRDRVQFAWLVVRGRR